MAAVGRSTTAAAAAAAAGEPAATVEAEASEEVAAEEAAGRAVRPASMPDGAATGTKRAAWRTADQRNLESQFFSDNFRIRKFHFVNRRCI
jgi:hypothetical protein